MDYSDEALVSSVSKVMFQDCAAPHVRGEDGERAVCLSAAAISIGAVTYVTRADPVMRKGGGEEGSTSGVLVGDNCCWQGLFAVLLRELTEEREKGEVRVVIVGGGSLARACSYALRRLPPSLVSVPPLLLLSSGGDALENTLYREHFLPMLGADARDVTRDAAGTARPRVVVINAQVWRGDLRRSGWTKGDGSRGGGGS